MTLRTNIATLVIAATAVALAGCATPPVAKISRDGRTPTVMTLRALSVVMIALARA